MGSKFKFDTNEEMVFLKEGREAEGSGELEPTIETKDAGGEKEKTLKEIGQERRAATLEKGKKAWEGIKGGFKKGLGWLKEKATGVVDYALASPEAVSRGAKAVGQAGVEAGQYATGKVIEGGEYVAGKATEAGAFVKEKTNAVIDGVRGKYEALSARGRQAYENMQGRVNSAKNKFNDWRNEKRLASLTLQEQQQGKTADALRLNYENAINQLQKTREMKAKIMEALRKSGAGAETAEAAI